VDALIARAGALLLRAAFAVLLHTGAAHAQVVSEHTVKAAFLLKFAGYVEWPTAHFATPDSPIVLGVSGSEEVAAALDALLPGRKVNGRAVVVKRLREGEVPQAVHIVFIGRGERNPRTAIRAAQQQGALAVTEAERGLEQGSAINLVRVDDRIAFVVSLESADKSGLRISARMLAVARRVVPR